MTVPPLAGVEAQALHLLTQAAAILRRRGVHNPEALLSRVVNRHLPGTDTEITRQIERAEKAEHRVRQLEARLNRKAPKPRFVGKARVVVLSRREVQVLELLKDRRGYREIAAELDISPSTAQNTITRVVRTIDAANRAEAVDMVVTGRVQIEVANYRRKGAAA